MKYKTWKVAGEPIFTKPSLLEEKLRADKDEDESNGPGPQIR